MYRAMQTLHRHVHVPIPMEMHARLKAESKRCGQPTTALVLEAIEVWLAEREREALCDAIADYARTVAGTPADLDPEMESASMEHLLDGDGR